MSRFDDCYDEDFPNQAQLYRANVQRAMKGKRGQAFLRELEEALLALPEKKLIEGRICETGKVCAMGALALKRRVSTGEKIEDALKWLEKEAPEDGYADDTAHFMEKHFGVLQCLSMEAAYTNDERRQKDPTDEARYEKVLAWVRENIVKVD